MDFGCELLFVESGGDNLAGMFTSDSTDDRTPGDGADVCSELLEGTGGLYHLCH